MSREEIFAVIKTNVQTIVEGAQGKEITEANSMRDFGADSLEMVEVVSRSMRQLKVKVPRSELAGAKGLHDLVDIFERAYARA